jgi:hypothetical protein
MLASGDGYASLGIRFRKVFRVTPFNPLPVAVEGIARKKEVNSVEDGESGAVHY